MFIIVLFVFCVNISFCRLFVILCEVSYIGVLYGMLLGLIVIEWFGVSGMFCVFLGLKVVFRLFKVFFLKKI